MNLIEMKNFTYRGGQTRVVKWCSTGGISSCTPKHNNGACLFAIGCERKTIEKSDYQLLHTTPSFCLLNIRVKQLDGF
jgi:hypothetical protein